MATFSYLYTNDVRIATLQEKITWVANAYVTDTVPNSSVNKSASNNFATIAYYFGLTRDSNLTKAAAMGNAGLVILNFIKKFQYPNPRTPESLRNEVACGEKFAPLREIVKVLVQFHALGHESYLTLEEIRLFFFYNSAIAKRENYNLIELCHQIVKYRTDGTLPTTITVPNPNDEFWKHETRQVRELTNILKKVKCIKEIDSELHLDAKSLTYQLKGLLFDIVTYDSYWAGSSRESYAKYFDITDEEINLFDKDLIKATPSPTQKGSSQIIWYGAPGTGKSFEVNERTKGHSVIRTTFHPDSDYSTFVGAYKPIMEEQEARVLPVVLGTGASFDTNNGTYKEKRIVYKFVKQAFLKAYLGAWNKYAENPDAAEPQFLVIEEINRGNCAQIFGDLFQLLDRENGFSKYPIEADDDLRREIDFAFNTEKNEDETLGEYRLSGDLDIDSVIPDYESASGATLSEDINKGRVLLLPPNLYIWATMNTSDQSLFPIDSAFKRRWEWKYVKISNGYKKENGSFVKDSSGNRIPLGWQIEGPDYSLDWWEFVQSVNAHISGSTSSDDKKLGYFFCKPKNGNSIDEETFAGKVLFYLWNDVFKDNDNRVFIVEEGQQEASFDVFYEEDEITGLIKPKSANILKFLENVMGEKGKSKIKQADAPEALSDDTSTTDETAEDIDSVTE